MRSNFEDANPPIAVAAPSSPLEFKPERYAAHLAEFDMTEAQKIELMEALWSIMWNFVEMGVDPKNCGQLALGVLLASDEPKTIVESFANSAGKSGSE
jgi:hypothetical protein